MLTRNGRVFIPFSGRWLWRYVPQPRWLRRWYYRKSFQWWGHPSNHHWKQVVLPCGVDGHFLTEWQGPRLRPGERDIWGGCYMHEGIDSRGIKEWMDARNRTG